MEGSAAYARDCLKADLRNARTLLGLLQARSAHAVRGAGGNPSLGGDVITQLERLVHDVTIGLGESRAGGSAHAPELDALRRALEDEAADAARERRIAEDTLRQWVRSCERLLPWWRALPTRETLLEPDRWPAPAPGASIVDLRVTADERFRVQRLLRTRDAVRARVAAYLAAHPQVRVVRLIDEDGEPVLTLVADGAPERLAG